LFFAGASGVYSQDNAKLYWDDVNDRLGVNKNAPQYTIDCAGEMAVSTLGNGIRVKEDISPNNNARQGVVSLVNGVKAVANSVVTANSRIFLTNQSLSGTVGSLYISLKSAGTGFTINSTSVGDNSLIAFLISEPA